MRHYAPVLGSPRLGQIGNLLTGGLTQDIAAKIVSSAEPATRAIVRDERNRLSEGLIGGIPFAALSGVAFVGTEYLVPSDKPTWKFIGYTAAFLGLGAGALFTFSKITETAAPPPSTAPAPALVVQAAQAIVDAADPKIRLIVQEERSRISAAAEAGLPYAAGGALALLASATLIPSDASLWKLLGYVGSIGLLSLGAYVALEKEQS
jgi:hypothetical protein